MNVLRRRENINLYSLINRSVKVEVGSEINGRAVDGNRTLTDTPLTRFLRFF